ncbi:hypothetical protein D3C72_1020930 [compost metagenome]
MVVAHLLRTALAAHHLFHRRVVQRVGTHFLGIDVVDQAAMAIHHVQVGTVAVVVRTQQGVEGAALAQVQGAADITAVLAAAVEHRVRDRDQQLAGGRLVGIADHRLAPLERCLAASAAQDLALQLQALRRGRDHPPIAGHDQRRIEAAGLQLQTAGLILRLGRIHVAVAKPGGGVGQLLLRGQQEVLRSLGQLGGIHAVGFQSVSHQLVALHAIAGKQRIGQGDDGAEQGQGKDQLAQVEPGGQCAHAVEGSGRAGPAGFSGWGNSGNRRPGQRGRGGESGICPADYRQNSGPRSEAVCPDAFQRKSPA